MPIWVSILLFLGLIFLGVLFILEGVSYLVSRHHLGNVGGAVGAGVVSIIGGIVFALARIPQGPSLPRW